MNWRMAAALTQLTHQLNVLYGANRKHDEGIGDERHQGESFSDHNPNSAGVVRALDIYPSKTGLNIYDLAEIFRVNRDPRIKYVISNRKIASAPGVFAHVTPWEWRAYHGSDPHTDHTHISVLGTPANPVYDKIDHPWVITPQATKVPAAPPPLVVPNPPASEMHDSSPRTALSWLLDLVRRLA